MTEQQLKEFAVSVFRTSLYSDSDVVNRALDQLTEDEAWMVKEYASRYWQLAAGVAEEKES